MSRLAGPIIGKVEDLRQRRVGKCHNRLEARQKPDFEYLAAGREAREGQPRSWALTPDEMEACRQAWRQAKPGVLVLAFIAAVVLAVGWWG